MKKKYTRFDNYVVSRIKKAFKFLETKYKCLIGSIEVGNSGLSIIYKNSTTAVRVCLDETGAGVYVELIRLVNNKIPERPIYHKGKHFFALGNILDVRATALKIDEPSLEDLVFNPGCEKVISSVIKQHAEALKMYAQDVLMGDFRIFEKLNKKFKSQIKR